MFIFYLTQFNQFYDIPEQCEIEMTIDKQSGKITMEGLKEELDKAKDKIFDLLRQFQKERWLDEEAKLVADTVQWSVMVCKYCHRPKPFILNSIPAQFFLYHHSKFLIFREYFIKRFPCFVSNCDNIKSQSPIFCYNIL